MVAARCVPPSPARARQSSGSSDGSACSRRNSSSVSRRALARHAIDPPVAIHPGEQEILDHLIRLGHGRAERYHALLGAAHRIGILRVQLGQPAAGFLDQIGDHGVDHPADRLVPQPRRRHVQAGQARLSQRLAHHRQVARSRPARTAARAGRRPGRGCDRRRRRPSPRPAPRRWRGCSGPAYAGRCIRRCRRGGLRSGPLCLARPSSVSQVRFSPSQPA